MRCAVARMCPAFMPADGAFAAGTLWSLTLHGKEELSALRDDLTAPGHHMEVGLAARWVSRILCSHDHILGTMGQGWRGLPMRVFKPRNARGAWDRRPGTQGSALHLPTRTSPNHHCASALSASRAHNLGAHILFLLHKSPYQVGHWVISISPKQCV